MLLLSQQTTTSRRRFKCPSSSNNLSYCKTFPFNQSHPSDFYFTFFVHQSSPVRPSREFQVTPRATLPAVVEVCPESSKHALQIAKCVFFSL